MFGLRERTYEAVRSLAPTQNTGPNTCGACIFWEQRPGYKYIGRCKKRWLYRLLGTLRDDTDGCRKWIVHLGRI